MNGKWTKENFIEHDKNNPEIYEMFEMFALQVAKVKKYYSAKNIFHRIRWETMIEENDSQFKIDDGWISHYARKFADLNPEHANLFQFRQRLNSYHGEQDAA
jgi:hypothetical protein